MADRDDERAAARPLKHYASKAEADMQDRFRDPTIRRAGPSDGPRPLRVPNVPLRRSGAESK